MKRWLKYGLIALIISFIARFIREFGSYSIINSILYFPVQFIDLNYDIVILMDLVAYIFWFFVGTLIGLIIDKIKSKGKKR